MTIEYWLQKKTIGGWSHVTSYTDLEQAKRNFASCVGNGLSGYCWRLVECKVIEEALLEEVVDIPLIVIDVVQKPLKPIFNMRPWGQPVQDAPKLTGWGQGTSGLNLKAGDDPSPAGFKSEGSEHGLSGSVWLVHHGLRKKTRVSADKVDAMLKEGYVKGSPRTQFE